MTDLMSGFDDLDEYYPGSRQRRRESPEARRQREVQTREEEPWDATFKAKRWTRKDTGQTYELFHIGALAKALHRRPVTIRSWIDKGWIPKARFKTESIPGTRGNAGRRLWSRSQIEGIVRIARQEGLLDKKPPPIHTTRFSERVFAEFKSWDT